VGTGPYILKEFVNDSSATYIRNTNYWETDPVGPGKGSQLPYMEQVKYLVIPDLSTNLAAFRTGKVDRLTAVMLEDGQAMLKSNPKTQYYQNIMAPYQVAMRTDRQDLPYKDLRVRKALMMATDMEGIKQSLYKGQAEILDSPARKLYSGVYTPLEQLPAETQEMYKYNPEKAKQLLKEAGYPNGFKTRMLLAATSTAGDLAAVLKDMWSKVGVDITLEPKDAALYNAAFATRNYDELFFGTQPGGTGQLYTRYGNSYFRGTNNFNLSYVNFPEGTDPTITRLIDEVQKVVMVDFDKSEALTKELNLYTLSQAFLIPLPAPYQYILWQPWIKNYYGEGSTHHWLQYMWIDQDLKKSLGY
jgi:peptide/nickel transport system substrate-binding protein